MRFKIARDGYKFVGFFVALTVGSLVLLTVTLHISFAVMAGIFLLLSVGCGIFFRDPTRVINPKYQDGRHIISPADGKIDFIKHNVQFAGQEWDQISIFLSVFDVHVNRSPATGTIEHIEYRKGRFKNAMRSDSSETNERKYIYMRTLADLPIIFVQIAGMFARRIVGFANCKVGNRLEGGERFGLIRLGSRMDVFLPSRRFVMRCRNGQKVRGGVTLLAEMI